jgi:hypothetical protein
MRFMEIILSGTRWKIRGRIQSGYLMDRAIKAGFGRFPSGNQLFLPLVNFLCPDWY